MKNYLAPEMTAEQVEAIGDFGMLLRLVNDKAGSLEYGVPF